MKCIILAASCSSRKNQLTNGTPKALLPIRGKPIIEYIVDKVQALDLVGGIYIVACHREFWKMERWLASYVSMIPIRLINDGATNAKETLGAIKDLALALEKEGIKEDILVLGGDNIFSFALSPFIEFARNIYPNNVIGVYELNGKHKQEMYGVLLLDENNKVIEFHEKPKESNGSRYLSACIYYFPREKIPLIPKYIRSGKGVNGTGSYIQWLTQNDSVYGHVFTGTWLDIGDTDAYTEAVLTF